MTNDPFIILFTDLDGTLLDHATYRWDEAKPALELCRRLHLPIILVSSKTRAEMDLIRRDLELSTPFISENGGGIFFPNEGDYGPPEGTSFADGLWKHALGVPYETLVLALREIRNELGYGIRGFSEMTLEEISHITGLNTEESPMALEREFDEPFLLQERDRKDVDALHKAAERKGFHITAGGRFYHLQGKIDKGDAVERIISFYREHHSQVSSIALGDSPNDFSMLERVDVPVLVRSSRAFPVLDQKIPGLTVTEETGPRGWNSAVLDILHNKIV